ncbi:MAG: ATP-grasp fold amidoligase family protein [Planctomycetia bacterium]|nr:ATP-grasp fold amidoligase family protein [Planctomycetia bacterium]
MKCEDNRSQAEKINYLKGIFKERVGYELNLDCPKTFNEKIQWYKMFYHDPLITRCTDKYLVKDWVRRMIGSGHTAGVYGVWDRGEEIDFELLPKSYVLKVNWGYRQQIIVPDKRQLDKQDAIKKLNHWLQPENHPYWRFLGWSGLNIDSKIIAEEYLIDPEVGEVRDYKFWCFQNQIKIVSVHRNGNRTVTNLDKDWNVLPYYFKNYPGDPYIAKPKTYEQMREYALILSKPFPFARVDFYSIGKRILLGEMTFSVGDGIQPFAKREWDDEIGKWFDINAARAMIANGYKYKGV